MALTGKTNEAKIWNYLKGKGLNACGVAGLMGNLYAESALDPQNLQNSYEKSLGYTDAAYTAAVDSGAYTNFVKDSAGYGLAQWTYWSRKEALLTFAKAAGASIGDLETQLNFLYKELNEGYTGVLSVLKTATSVREASDAVLLNYERPANQSVSVQEKRASYGSDYYSKYAAQSSTTTPTTEGGKTMGKTITIGNIVDKINGITINASKPCNSGNYENATSRTVAYVVMHYTGNSKDTAKANANYFQTSGRNASAHLFVDDSEIYQSVELRDKAWHCGTSGTYYHSSCRNANSIGIEMCCTAGNYKISEITKKNAAYLCAYLCKLLGISASEIDTYVLRHYDVTHKVCPAQMAGAQNGEWTAFKDMVRSILSSGSTGSDNSNGSSSTASSFTVGDIVQFTGSTHYASADASNGPACKPGKAKITAVYPTGKHPFHLIAVSGSGSTVYGWVDADKLNAIGEISVGDVVQFSGGPHYASASASTAANNPKAGPAKVTAISKGARHPYHIIHTTSASTVYGWVDASSVSK